MVDMADLTLAYTRRKRFEAKLLAMEMSKIMSTPCGGGSPTRKQATPPDRIHPDIMFSNMGINIQ